MKNLNFAAAFDASPNPYVVMTPTFVILSANLAYLRVTGRRLQDIVDRSMFDAFPSGDGEAESGLMLRESLERTVALGRPDHLPLIKYSIADQTADGPVFRNHYWSATHTPLFGIDGAVSYVLQHTEDVTAIEELRQQQRFLSSTAQLDDPMLQQRFLSRAQALQEQNRLLHVEADLMRRLFAQAPGFMAFFRGPRHVFDMANAAYETLVARQDLIGMPVREALPDLHSQGLFELMDEIYVSGAGRLLRSRSIWLRLGLDRQLEERFVDVMLQPVIEADGSVSGIFVQGNDITEQCRAQHELARHRDQLEHLVAERTRALEHSEEERRVMQATLHQSQKMEAIGKLTGGVAHDFNNVLQVIAGNLQLLRQAAAPDDVKTQRRVDSAMRGVERGARLASHLLAFARKQPLSPQVLNIDKLVRNLDDMLRRALGETIELETVIGGGTWNTLVDRNFLENAILNLAINARDAMSGNGKLTIEAGNASLDDAYANAHSEVAAGQYVLIAVSDTGTGMSEEVIQQVFEPFFTTKAEGHGTGLGLSMVYGFVKQSGGHVKIYSEVGHGTTVKLYLPRSYETELLEEKLSVSPVSGGSETILVVEDDAQVRETVVDLLAELGYRVLKAPDAAKALAVIESGVAIDLLFTDVVMPGAMRSPELARRAVALQPHIEVLFTSGYTENSIVHGGRLDPGIALLSKPYRRDDLARKVRDMLNNRRHVVGLEEEVSHLSAENSPGDSTTRNMRSLRILVVEDSTDALSAVLELLEHLGHRPQGVTSAEHALAAMTKEKFDVLMTDLGLPGKSGDTLAREALALQPLQVIYATGMAKVENSVPDAVFLKKPFGKEDMKSALEKAASFQKSFN